MLNTYVWGQRCDHGKTLSLANLQQSCSPQVAEAQLLLKYCCTPLNLVQQLQLSLAQKL